MLRPGETGSFETFVPWKLYIKSYGKSKVYIECKKCKKGQAEIASVLK